MCIGITILTVFYYIYSFCSDSCFKRQSVHFVARTNGEGLLFEGSEMHELFPNVSSDGSSCSIGLLSSLHEVCSFNEVHQSVGAFESLWSSVMEDIRYNADVCFKSDSAQVCLFELFVC